MNEQEKIDKEFYRWLSQVEIDLRYFMKHYYGRGEADSSGLFLILKKIRKQREETARRLGHNQDSPGLNIDEEILK